MPHPAMILKLTSALEMITIRVSYILGLKRDFSNDSYIKLISVSRDFEKHYLPYYSKID